MPLSFHTVLGWLLVGATLAMIGFWVPPGVAELGTNYLIFYFHFPSAINSMNLFYFAGVASLAYFFAARPLPAKLARFVGVGGWAGAAYFVAYACANGMGRLADFGDQGGIARILRDAVLSFAKVGAFLRAEVKLADLPSSERAVLVVLCLLLGAAGVAVTLAVAQCLARRRERARWDLWAVSAVEVGLLACTVTLVTGGLWARAAWGEWEDWVFSDPRLLSVYIMWFTYAGYLALRSTVDDEVKRERFCAVFGTISMINLPIVYLSIRVFSQAHHPMSVSLSDGSMVVTRWFGVLAFLVLYVALWRLRFRVHNLRHDVDRFQEELGRRGI